MKLKNTSHGSKVCNIRHKCPIPDTCILSQATLRDVSIRPPGKCSTWYCQHKMQLIAIKGNNNAGGGVPRDLGHDILTAW